MSMSNWLRRTGRGRGAPFADRRGEKRDLGTEKPVWEGIAQPCVTAVTDRVPEMGDTANVNMVRRVSKKTLLEPVDTRQQWKGEAAASFVFVKGSPVAARYRPPAPATGPRFYLV